ncbi:endoribonuclease L-PSP [Mediterraneibacter gnavus]|uniref:Endoribonuclease L-PSP n=1 Tax=Mediterraneibacter gnavus TaxID=33038 RepID=A0A3E4UMP9_MEDGN|nr:endoribonuclease L-PSP [Mediterraneibacter gnavus]
MGAKRRIFRWICQVFLAKKWGILIKKESESLIFTGLEIPRDYITQKEEKIWQKF